MKYLDWKSNYDKYPETLVLEYDHEAFAGWANINASLNRIMTDKKVLTVDCYPGVDNDEVLGNLIREFKPQRIIDTEDIFYDGEKITDLMKNNLTHDRVRGIMYYGSILDFIDETKLSEAKHLAASSKDRLLIYGFGAALVTRGDILIYADLARWEIQQRYRRGMPNYKQKNYDEDFLRKYKRGYFAEWRIADKHKKSILDDIDFYLDTNTVGKPKMVTGNAFSSALKTVTKQPFRLVPYFDPGVWGGQWMKEICNLNRNEDNFAWAFDGVPEENSIYFRFGDIRLESPAMNLTLSRPEEFLGQKTFARFGAECPLRFDLLDTMDGQNLSLQVHPDTDYIHKKFGMPYTQDESYYILDAGDSGGVYLGLKESIDSSQMIKDLESAQSGTAQFDVEKYVNFFPAKKYDHFLIPAGTIHCSSKNCMVLEISATPYIFTFKLWDWDRVGLDGLKRPIHIEDGKAVLRFNRTTEWVEKNLINRFEQVRVGDGYSEIRTGLHELEFIETRVFTITQRVEIESNGEFAMLNLVDGKAVVIESPGNIFLPYEVNYAETFIIPAGAGNYTARPCIDGDSVKLLKANVRF